MMPLATWWIIPRILSSFIHRRWTRLIPWISSPQVAYADSSRGEQQVSFWTSTAEWGIKPTILWVLYHISHIFHIYIYVYVLLLLLVLFLFLKLLFLLLLWLFWYSYIYNIIMVFIIIIITFFDYIYYVCTYNMWICIS